MANFSLTLDRQTRKALDRLARVHERKPGDMVRVLIREKARELDAASASPLPNTGQGKREVVHS